MMKTGSNVKSCDVIRENIGQATLLIFGEMWGIRTLMLIYFIIRTIDLWIQFEKFEFSKDSFCQDSL